MYYVLNKVIFNPASPAQHCPSKCARADKNGPAYYRTPPFTGAKFFIG